MRLPKKRYLISALSFAAGWWVWREYDRILAAYISWAMRGMEDDPDNGFPVDVSRYPDPDDFLEPDVPDYAGVKPSDKHPLISMLETLRMDRLSEIAFSAGVHENQIQSFATVGGLAQHLLHCFNADSEDDPDRIEWLMDNLHLAELRVLASQTSSLPVETIRASQSKGALARSCVIEWRKLPEEVRNTA